MTDCLCRVAADRARLLTVAYGWQLPIKASKRSSRDLVGSAQWQCEGVAENSLVNRKGLKDVDRSSLADAACLRNLHHAPRLP
jgi:hypothetical protein